MCFADDLLLFCKATPPAVECVMDTFQRFSECSGLMANRAKSSVYMGGISYQVKGQIIAVTSFSSGTFPMRYLGVPLTYKRWSKVDCYSLMQKITSKMDSWPARSLSYVGRRVLVQTVLQALISYWSSMFLLPQSVVKMVDNCCKKFMWGIKRSGKCSPIISQLGTNVHT